MSGRVLPISEAARRIAHERARGRRVVTTNGVFDLLHAGHRYLFAECRKLGDVLVVGVNSDTSVRALKGPGRPFQGEDLRARNVARYADVVFVFDEHDPGDALRIVRPDIHVTAETYRSNCPEASVVDEIGATLEFVPVLEDLGSSTKLIRGARRRRISAWAAITLAASPVLRAIARRRRGGTRVLLVPQNGIGDAVQVSPLVRALAVSGFDVDVLVPPVRAPLIAGNPLVSTFEPLTGARARLLVRLWRRRYSAVVVLPDRPFLRCLGLWLCAPVRIGAWRSEAAEPSLDCFSTHLVPWSRGESKFEQAMRVAETLGAKRVDHRLEIGPAPGAYEGADRWIADHELTDRPFVVLNPSAGARVKEWPLERWSALGTRLAGEGCAVVVSTGSASVATRLVADVARPGDVFDASSLSLLDAGAVSARASCFAAADTGPLYVAAAMGARLVIVAGATDPRETFPPPGPRVTHVLPDEDGSTSVDSVHGAIARYVRADGVD